jgi:uncharacterized protein YacL
MLSNNVSDYLRILNGAIITDLIVVGLTIFGFIRSRTLREWYNKYGLSAIMADVLSITIGIIIAMFVYPLLFKKENLALFIGVAIAVQLVHDLLFAGFFNAVPRGKSRILDTFKDYAKEIGATILLADASMIVSTIILGLLLSQMSIRDNVFLLIVLLYLVPYFLYSL